MYHTIFHDLNFSLILKGHTVRYKLGLILSNHLDPNSLYLTYRLAPKYQAKILAS